MGRRRASAAGSGEPTEFTQTLLARLGLPPDASPHDIEAAHGRLVAFLDSAPPDLHSWARQQSTAVGAAFALLTDPGTDLRGETVRDGRDGRDDESSVDGEPDEAPDEAFPDESDDEFDEDQFDEDEFDRDESAPAGSGKMRAGARDDRARAAGSSRQAGPKKPAESRTERRATRGNPRRPALVPSKGWQRRSRFIPIALILVIAATVYGVYRLGDRDGVPALSASASPTAQPLDQAKVAALMKKLDTNPRDVDTLRALGDLYFQAADYKTAASWQQKVVDINTKDVTARLALGAALFNSGDAAAAEKQWREVIALDPKHAEAHYDLGFLYLSKNPPDMAKVKAEWAKVIEIDANSDLAKTVSAHLQRLETASPSSSAPSPSANGR